MKLEDIEKRLTEIPVFLENLRAEFNQLLGYKQALTDLDKNQIKRKKKND